MGSGESDSVRPLKDNFCLRSVLWYLRYMIPFKPARGGSKGMSIRRELGRCRLITSYAHIKKMTISTIMVPCWWCRTYCAMIGVFKLAVGSSIAKLLG